MTDRLLTPESLSAGRVKTPPLIELRVLERRLVARLVELDARVDRLLDTEGPSFLDAAAEIDVLCASIDEAQGLLDEARIEIGRALDRQAQRRRGLRRWA